MNRYVVTSSMIFFAVLVTELNAQNCDPRLGRFHQFTEDFFYIASSDQGAVGDVVAVEISVVSQVPRSDIGGFGLVVCYDEALADLLPEVAYSDVLEELTYMSVLTPLEKAGVGRGLSLWGAFRRERAENYFPTTQPVPFATLFFRLKGKPGDSFEVKFCDFVFPQQIENGPCYKNFLSYASSNSDTLTSLSTVHQSGQVRIVEGEATRPDPPALPPQPRVYPAAPSTETSAIHFEMTGAVTAAGARDLPLEVFVTSNFEFGGFSTSISYPSRYLEITRVVEHTRPGIVRWDNFEGNAGIFLGSPTRRIGAEGERVHLATLYFNVKDEAREVPRVDLAFEPGMGFLNWLLVLSESGNAFNKLPVSTQVEPLLISNAILQIRAPGRMTLRGDANFDLTLDISDPLAVLGYLFLGDPEPECPAAADVDQSGQLDITDPISMLGALFLGEPPISTLEPREVPCD